MYIICGSRTFICDLCLQEIMDAIVDHLSEMIVGICKDAMYIKYLCIQNDYIADLNF